MGPGRARDISRGAAVIHEPARAELWLTGRRLGPLEIANTPWRRFRGLLGRRTLEGALLLRPCSSVHTLGMRMTIDVAHLTKDLAVLDVRTMRPHRFGRAPRRSRAVLETQAGVMQAWDLHPGDRLEIRDHTSLSDPGRSDSDKGGDPEGASEAREDE